MATTYTVKKGDTLSQIALDNGTTVAKLVELNDITDPDYIVVGQVLTLSGTATAAKKSTSSRATIKAFGLQANTDRTMYATWTWTKSNTENYKIMWYYATGDGLWFIGTDSTVTAKQCTYNAPSNATRVKFKVKPISKKRKVNDKEVSYWTASWSTEKTYDFSNNPPTAPSTPSVEIKQYKITSKLDNLDVNATHIQFQVVKNNSSVCTSGLAPISTSSATFVFTASAGNRYKVRARSKRGKQYSDWSDYSNEVTTAPACPKTIISLKAISETSVYIDWENVSNCKEYTVEYTTQKRYFDSSNEVQSLKVDGTVAGHAEVTGLESGKEYFFRVRASNDTGESSWSEIKSVVVGKKPAAPTTWSSSTTVVAGEPLNLYFAHNSEDGSDWTYAEIYMKQGGEGDSGVSITKELLENTTPDDEEITTYSCPIDTSEFEDGASFKWYVRTAGITKEFGDYSVERTVTIYGKPSLELSVTNSAGEALETLTSFPFYISGLAGPNTQKPVTYHVSIVANDAYETVDAVGNVKMVNKGEAVYSKLFDTSLPLLIELSAGNIDLENNVSYTIHATVSMDSGLTADATSEFTVSWTDMEYEPNAEIGIDEETLTASIRPYCEDEDGNLIEGVSLSVYRREYDGKFTELMTGIDNLSNTFITDPHPALDYARYRIVAITDATGAVSYYDVPGYPVGGTAVIIQWSEEWSNFNTSNEDPTEQPPWSGSLLKLPYNIDVSDSNTADVSLVKYIGREHPVSYYGTQLGTTSTWNVDVPKEDKDTLYALRRLAVWMDNVYVREPSGSGYWASISISFSQKHNDLVIPVTINVTRVEGGV